MGKDVIWRDRLASELPAFGHRNWIVVADAAYPKQSAPGLETICTSEGQVEVLEEVLAAIDAAPHVRPIVLLDAELKDVADDESPGADAYRARLEELLSGRPHEYVDHEKIIKEMDEAAQMFNILLLKTDMTIPYTSVFIVLDCGYWSEEQEKRLRAAIESKK